MQRVEKTGLGIAIAGHVLLFGALSLALNAAPKLVPPFTRPVDIQIVDKVGLKDTAPNPSTVEPSPSIAPEIGAPVEAPSSKPVPKQPAQVATAPKPLTVKPKVANLSPKPPHRVAPVEPPHPKLSLNLSPPEALTPRGSRLGKDFLKGVTERSSASTAHTTRAVAGPASEASLAREVLRQLKPHWKAPTGADAEQLRTLLSIRLNSDGTVAAVKVIETTGVTDSNRGQVRLHQEAAVKAVRLAAPFVLPAELYDAWQVLEPVTFDKRLG